MMRARGAALPETALVLGLALTLIFGTFEVGLIGYTQLASDGAAYVAAHSAMLGSDPVAAAASPFPQISPSSITVAQNAPDTTDVPVNYDQTSLTNRHGGLQLVRPMHLQASVTQNDVGVPSGLTPIGNVDLTAAAIEGNMMVNGPSFDVGGTAMNSPATYGGVKTYFQDDGNAPPYFIGFRSFYDCLAITWGNDCSDVQMRAVALAEYLDGDNWANPQNGIGPNGVYQAMLLHQQVYAKIAAAMQATITPSSSDVVPRPGETPGPSMPANRQELDRCVETVQGWDITVPSGSTVYQYNQYPLTPTENAYQC